MCWSLVLLPWPPHSALSDMGCWLLPVPLWATFQLHSVSAGMAGTWGAGGRGFLLPFASSSTSSISGTPAPTHSTHPLWFCFCRKWPLPLVTLFPALCFQSKDGSGCLPGLWLLISAITCVTNSLYCLQHILNMCESFPSFLPSCFAWIWKKYMRFLVQQGSLEGLPRGQGCTVEDCCFGGVRKPGNQDFVMGVWN